MIVFDASGSMSPATAGGYGSETAGTLSRLDKVRATLEEVLPSITRMRRVGLITLSSLLSWPTAKRPMEVRHASLASVHVISLRVRGLTRMGEQSVLDAKCLAEQNGGLYLTAETQDELKDVVEKTLGCVIVTESAKP